MMGRVLAIFIAILALVSPATATTYLVRPDGSGDFPTIQAALDGTGPWDIIELADGTFSGEGNRDIDYLGNPITIRSQSGNARACIIDCQGTPDDPHRGVYFHREEGPESILESVTICNGHVTGVDEERNGGGVLCGSGTSPTFIGVVFLDNTAQRYGGGLCCHYSSATMIGCTFAFNQGWYGGGFDCHAGQASLVNCTFYGNGALCGSGIRSSNSDITVENTIIASGYWGPGLSCDDDGSALLSCCDIIQNEGGDWVECISDQYGINGNIAEDPMICAGLGGDFHLAEASPCAPHTPPNEDCDLIGAWPVGCIGWEPSVIIVAPDGSGDYPTIQEAINAAGMNGIIELEPGVFIGDGNRDLSFHSRRVTIRSQTGDPESCVLDCQGSEDDQHRGLCLDGIWGAALRVQGITIANAYSDGSGGGIRLDDRDLTLINCILSNNEATYGGGVHCPGNHLQIERCVFRENTADRGGGAYLGYGSGPHRVTTCEFDGNVSLWGRGGALYLNNSPAAVDSCTFVDNLAPLGGGIYTDGADPDITHCTFYGNGADQGAGVWCVDGRVTIENTIVAFSDFGEAIYCDGDYFASLACCDIYGNEGGDWTGFIAWMQDQFGNISEDPRFCGDLSESSPYTLLNTSPCASYTPPNEECDLIGAWRVGCSLTTDAAEEIPRTPDVSLSAGSPNPFSTSTTISYSIPARSTNPPFSLRVYDAAGRLVRRLAEGTGWTGQTRIVWDGTDDSGGPLAAGIYLCQLHWDSERRGTRLLLLR